MSWTRDEVEQAYQDYQSKVRAITASGDWAPFADLFTSDAVYIEHLFGRFEGREAIRAWITKTMSRFPGDLMTGFPHEWYVIDEVAGRVVCKIWNDMPDPGDGKHYSAYNITILEYAGDGLWKSEEDVYNPAAFDVMIKDWTRAKEASG